MLFKAPPQDPWSVVSGQSDYMAWTIDNNSQNPDNTDRICCLTTKFFPAKIFLQINENFARKFCEAHSMFRPQTVVRVKNCQVDWIQWRPEFKEIEQQANILMDRTMFRDIHPQLTKDKRKSCIIFPEPGFKTLYCDKLEIKSKKNIKDILKRARRNKNSTTNTVKCTVKFIGQRPIDTLEKSFKGINVSEHPQYQNDSKIPLVFNQKLRILSSFSKLRSSANYLRSRIGYRC